MVFTPGIQEKITDQSAYIGCIAMEPNGMRRARRAINLVDASGNSVVNSGNNPSTMKIQARGDGSANKVLVDGPITNEGELYKFECTFYSGRDENFMTQIDAGGYTGANVSIPGDDDRRVWSPTSGSTSYYGNGFFYGFLRSGGFQITWKDGGSGTLTLEVQDLTRNRAIPVQPVHR